MHRLPPLDPPRQAEPEGRGHCSPHTLCSVQDESSCGKAIALDAPACPTFLLNIASKVLPFHPTERDRERLGPARLPPMLSHSLTPAPRPQHIPTSLCPHVPVSPRPHVSQPQQQGGFGACSTGEASGRTRCLQPHLQKPTQNQLGSHSHPVPLTCCRKLLRTALGQHRAGGGWGDPRCPVPAPQGSPSPPPGSPVPRLPFTGSAPSPRVFHRLEQLFHLQKAQNPTQLQLFNDPLFKHCQGLPFALARSAEQAARPGTRCGSSSSN